LRLGNWRNAKRDTGNTSIVGSILAPNTNTSPIGYRSSTTPYPSWTAQPSKHPPYRGLSSPFPAMEPTTAGPFTCTGFAGRITIQSVPNSGTLTSPQTFNLTTQFAVSGATWIKMDPSFGSGKLSLTLRTYRQAILTQSVSAQLRERSRSER
jgi:hypothetical protein